MFEQIAKDIADTVKESVQNGIKALSEKFDPRLKALEDRIDALPLPVKGDKGDSVSVDDVLPLLENEVSKAVQNIALPEIDYDVVKTFIAQQVEALPVPQDGKSITADDVAPLLKELVSEIEMPIPEKGEDGKSVTLEDVKPLIADAVKYAVAEIPPPKEGAPDKDADPIDMVAIQKMIDDAVAAALARVDIPAPRNGEDGKDALDIEILASIDPEKSYNRNTYALHKGGLWRSFERTNGLRGWETVVDGIADIQIEYDGERGVKITTEKSSGEVIAKDFAMPIVIDRGVYKDGQEYARNDGVTFGGSFWIAQKDMPAGKPGDGNSDFRLAVKKGRDANAPVKVK